MKKAFPSVPGGVSTGRRQFMGQAAALGAVGMGAGWAGDALAQAPDLAPYRSAKINWRQAEGETISVAVIPASYFENLIALLPQFEALTGALTKIAAGVPAGDRVGLLSVRRGGVNIPPSTDRTAIRAAVDSLRGQSSTETDEAFNSRLRASHARKTGFWKQVAELSGTRS